MNNPNKTENATKAKKPSSETNLEHFSFIDPQIPKLVRLKAAALLMIMPIYFSLMVVLFPIYLGIYYIRKFMSKTAETVESATMQLATGQNMYSASKTGLKSDILKLDNTVNWRQYRPSSEGNRLQPGDNAADMGHG